ncbi:MULTISPECIES: 4'-phosphopantetheinyl transferase family protein [unclassified Francisella]|uniref:4'-phosphopantetheinyl transferase family protein n=1 Tax=unclassified Francisella TaxID=2610885 RepID=UPI002E367280|nr:MULTISPECIES: 4'-phosphopantetheinyl transferase superfamily protein [unclassified Francisella]MED7818876.1 4'-phosphopantetheinyl transferase superfamily protein [Francisella sp. 19S2-4]MED7829669.1 4'-phosphopantetheinyl transferase superfamily protein [Francisella sp. 19S2-10]
MSQIDLDIIPDNQVLEVKKYKFKIDQDKRLLARSFLYNYLKSKYQINSFELKYGQYQKPVLKVNNSIDFSVSYSEEYIIVAISNKYNIGVDIEFIDTKINHQDLINIIMHPEEISYYNQLTNEFDKLDFFFEVFNAKEAVIKSLGMGLYFNVQNINILDVPSFSNFINKEYFLNRRLFDQLDNYKTSICLVER